MSGACKVELWPSTQHGGFLLGTVHTASDEATVAHVLRLAHIDLDTVIGITNAESTPLTTDATLRSVGRDPGDHEVFSLHLTFADR